MATASIDAISWEEVLAAREARSMRQAAALRRFGRPLLSLTIVMPSEVKDGWLPRRIMEVALHQIDFLIRTKHWRLLSLGVSLPPTGPEALYVLDVDPKVLKATLIDLEEHHPIGRLWDFDVITTSGVALSRTHLGNPARRCLICDRPARECGRSRRHSIVELRHKIQTMVDDFDVLTRT